jgi:hypothetical protein
MVAATAAEPEATTASRTSRLRTRRGMESEDDAASAIAEILRAALTVSSQSVRLC